MIGFKLSLLIVSSKIPQYTDNDLIIWNVKYNETKYNYVKVYTLNKLKSYDELLLFLNNHKEIDCIITNCFTDKLSVGILNSSSTEIVRKLVEFNDFPSMQRMVNATIETFKLNVNRVMPKHLILFSFYTSTYNTSKEQLDNLYYSIRNQTYSHWNWYIIDDSTNDECIKTIQGYNDSRIIIIKNVTNHGNIGFNKHNIAMICNGDWLLEIDHDDEIVPDCLSTIYDAILKFPNSKFIYSDAVEKRVSDDTVNYGEEHTFCEGLGIYRDEIVNGTKYTLGFVDGLNPISIRSILAAPNHIRCFEKSFYHKINGHSQYLSILDDLDLMIRAFLNISSINEITYIKKILYIQNNVNTTSDSHVAETVSYNTIIFKKYDSKIHDKLVELNIEDKYYDETFGFLYNPYEYDKNPPLLCNVYK